MTKVWTRDEIDALLMSNDAAVERAILRLHALQTDAEQVSHNTAVDNARGFSKAHAVPGTRFAEWLTGKDRHGVQKWQPKSLNHPMAAKVFARYCKDGQTPMDRARRIALVHSQQLTDIANGVLKA